MNKFRINNVIYVFLFFGIIYLISCNKDTEDIDTNTTDKIKIDSLTANYNLVRAWDTTTIVCYASGQSLVYSWECDHGNFNGQGDKIRYAAGECCVGTNTITCTVSNEYGKVSESIQIIVTSYFSGGK